MRIHHRTCNAGRRPRAHRNDAIAYDGDRALWLQRARPDVDHGGVRDRDGLRLQAGGTQHGQQRDEDRQTHDPCYPSRHTLAEVQLVWWQLGATHSICKR